MEKVKPTANTEAKGTDSVLLYLPYGWEFAIITIKPPKGCNNTENEAVRHSLAQPVSRAEARSWVLKKHMAL